MYVMSLYVHLVADDYETIGTSLFTLGWDEMHSNRPTSCYRRKRSGGSNPMHVHIQIYFQEDGKLQMKSQGPPRFHKFQQFISWLQKCRYLKWKCATGNKITSTRAVKKITRLVPSGALVRRYFCEPPTRLHVAFLSVYRWIFGSSELPTGLLTLFLTTWALS